MKFRTVVIDLRWRKALDKGFTKDARAITLLQPEDVCELQLAQLLAVGAIVVVLYPGTQKVLENYGQETKRCSTENMALTPNAPASLIRLINAELFAELERFAGPHLWLFASNIKPGWTCCSVKLNGYDIPHAIEVLAASEVKTVSKNAQQGLDI